jgi:mRNA-degrading endonuclease RelE of RelBE toxin-antitoxin system
MASFRVEVDREIQKATRRLPGNIRQRVLRALKGLRDEPRPAGSEALDVGAFELPPGVEPRRIRMESWRIVYVVEEEDLRVSVLAIRQRPPYQYDDLSELFASILDR